MLELIQTAQTTGFSAKYVLFDSWFSSLKIILALKKEQELDTISIIKKSSKIKYGYQDGKDSIKKIYRRNKKRRGYLLRLYASVIKATEKSGLHCSLRISRQMKEIQPFALGR